MLFGSLESISQTYTPVPKLSGSWTRIPGQRLAKISKGKSGVWGVNTADKIYKLNADGKFFNALSVLKRILHLRRQLIYDQLNKLLRYQSFKFRIRKRKFHACYNKYFSNCSVIHSMHYAAILIRTIQPLIN